MKTTVVISLSLVVAIFVSAICFLTVPSLPGPSRALELSVGTIIGTNGVSRTFSITISNVDNSIISYPAAGLDAGHHPLLDLGCQTNSVWKYTIEPNFSGLTMKLPPHGVLRCQIKIPNDVYIFKVGLIRIDLTWRGRLGLDYLDAKNRSKIDWSPEYEITNNIAASIKN